MRQRRGPLAVAVALMLVLSGCTQPGAAPGPDIEDFEFDTFAAEYVLLRDADGRSVLRTTETMTAVFPDSDQNRGIVRTIERYPSAAIVGFEVVEVTDGAGTRRPFEIEQTEDVITVVVAVPEGEFVHGEQTYEITYQQRDVITGDGEVQQFGWDVNGTEWRQPFATVTADIELADGLASEVYNEPFCWVHGNDDDATFDCAVRGGEGFYDFEQTDLEPGRSLHLFIEFQPGTFG